jgi:hypothetical protein
MAEPMGLEPATSDVTGQVCLNDFQALRIDVSKLENTWTDAVVMESHAHASFTGTPTAQ